MREVLAATGPDGEEARYLLEIIREGEHWASTLAKFNADGEVEAGRVAPRFYGTSEEQARRRMITILENQFEEVRSLGEQPA